MSLRSPDRPLRDPYCWNCGQDKRGGQLLTILEAARYCKVSINAVYRWMDLDLIDWVYNAGGRRRIYKHSLIRLPGQDPRPLRAVRRKIPALSEREP